MKYVIYKNEWSSPNVDPFTTIDSDDCSIIEGAFVFSGNNVFQAAYPMSAFYVVVLED